jgi:hypothetical protein
MKDSREKWNTCNINGGLLPPKPTGGTMKFGLDFIRKLRPCRFRFNAPLDDGREHLGFIAQEVDKLVSGKEFGLIGRNEEGIYSINYFEFIAPIVKAIQELDERTKKSTSGATTAPQPTTEIVEQGKNPKG